MSRKQVKGQQYFDDNGSSEIPAEEFQAIVRAIYDPENYKHEMHRKALENALENLLSDYYAYEVQDSGEKRSIATLAKNGQLPASKEPEPEEELELADEADDNGHKRNLASMARSGLIGGKRNIQSLARQLQYVNGKRNIGSLMRGGNSLYPGSGKRNIAALAKYGGYNGKRNVGTLARDWSLPRFSGAKYMEGN